MSATAKNHAWVNLSYRSWEIDVSCFAKKKMIQPQGFGMVVAPKKLSARLTKELMEDFGEDFFWDILTSNKWGTI